MDWYIDVENGEGNVGKRPFSGQLTPGMRVFKRTMDGGSADYEEYIVNSKGEPFKPDYRYMQGGARSEMLNPDTGQWEQMVLDNNAKRLPQGFADSMGLQYQIAPGNESGGSLLGMALKEWGPPAAMMAGAYGLGNALGAATNALSGGTTAAGTAGAFPMPAAVEPGFVGSVKNMLSSIPSPTSLFSSGGGSGSAGTAAGTAAGTGAGTMADIGMWDVVKNLAGPAANLVGGLLGSNAAGNAVDAQTKAGQDANALQWQMFQQNQANMQPWLQAGTGAVNQLAAGIQPGGALVKPFSMADYQADPGYGFRLSEGMKAIERSAAARGNLLSGGVLKGITRYGQDQASNEYQNAYNRYNQDQGNAYNRLAGVAGTGQNAVNQLSGMGQSTAQNVGNTMQGIGNARASGYMGEANALSGGLTGAYNAYQSGQLLNSLMNNRNPVNYGSYNVDPYSVSGEYGDR